MAADVAGEIHAVLGQLFHCLDMCASAVCVIVDVSLMVLLFEKHDDEVGAGRGEIGAYAGPTTFVFVADKLIAIAFTLRLSGSRHRALDTSQEQKGAAGGTKRWALPQAGLLPKQS